ncbi:MAG: potassium transporter TrkG [Candidatus Cloacimonas sp.]|nr:potassium transporter Trk [Candidatus Cloacimonadota bacterium]
MGGRAKLQYAASISIKFSNGLLNLYAFLNLLILFSTPFLARSDYFIIANHSYTLLLLGLLVINLISGVVEAGGDSIVLRKRALDILFVFLAVALQNNHDIFQLYIVIRQAFIGVSRRHRAKMEAANHRSVLDSAPAFVLISFLGTILIGTILLLIPVATNPGNHTTFLGALFTSTSATCVTGLTVYDIVSHFSTFGLMIIMILIQIGGLGIMTVSTFFAVITGQRLSLRDGNLMQDVIDGGNRVDALKLVRNIVIVTLIFEAIGAVLIYFSIKGRYVGTSEAVFSAVFHSISGFCNAGIGLFQEDFVFYHQHLLATFTIIFLVVSGGIGFSVLVDIKRNMFEKFTPSRFTIHTKLVLITTAALIVLGSILFFIGEFNHSMEGYSLKDRIIGSVFQSVSTRTAGFYYIDLTHLSQASSFFSLLLMFIGASPGSTGGGIKTTSFALFILAVVAVLSGNKDVVVFKRKIPESLVYRVMALIAVSLTLLFVVIFILLLIEPFPSQTIIFEAVSAYGTVGLSMGITPYLTKISQILLVVLMYFGRVGPLTILFALSRGKGSQNYYYLEEKISVG